MALVVHLLIRLARPPRRVVAVAVLEAEPRVAAGAGVAHPAAVVVARAAAAHVVPAAVGVGVPRLNDLRRPTAACGFCAQIMVASFSVCKLGGGVRSGWQ